ncbi:LacI family transcriptional regulator [Spirochaetia bacterium]|nr:LacI family transcriptional regulator [Spirochaetia bacterium]
MAKITVKDIAQAGGFSEATVSRALNGSSSVTVLTKKKIFEVARRLGYKPGLVSPLVSGSQGHNKKVGIIIRDITNPFFSSITSLIFENLENSGYQAFITTLSRSSKQEHDSIKMLVDIGVCGIIAAPRSARTIDNIRTLIGSAIPTVLIFDTYDDPEVHFVSIDHEKAMFKGTEYLINLGHRKIYYIGADPENLVIRERVQGFEKALAVNHIPPNQYKILHTPANRTGGYSAVTSILNSGDCPTAIVAATDYVAFGAMEALKEHSLRIPADISLMGFDNVEMSSYSSISLTTIAQPDRELSDRAVNMLINQIEHRDRLDRKHVILDSSLIIRDTCRRII